MAIKMGGLKIRGDFTKTGMKVKQSGGGPPSVRYNYAITSANNYDGPASDILRFGSDGTASKVRSLAYNGLPSIFISSYVTPSGVVRPDGTRVILGEISDLNYVNSYVAWFVSNPDGTLQNEGNPYVNEDVKQPVTPVVRSDGSIVVPVTRTNDSSYRILVIHPDNTCSISTQSTTPALVGGPVAVLNDDSVVFVTTATFTAKVGVYGSNDFYSEISLPSPGGASRVFARGVFKRPDNSLLVYGFYVTGAYSGQNRYRKTFCMWQISDGVASLLEVNGPDGQPADIPILTTSFLVPSFQMSNGLIFLTVLRTINSGLGLEFGKILIDSNNRVTYTSYGSSDAPFTFASQKARDEKYICDGTDPTNNVPAFVQCNLDGSETIIAASGTYSSDYPNNFTGLADYVRENKSIITTYQDLSTNNISTYVLNYDNTIVGPVATYSYNDGTISIYVSSMW